MWLKPIPVFLCLNIAWFYSYVYQHLWQTGVVPVRPVIWYIITLSLGMVLFITNRDAIKIESTGKRFIALGVALTGFAGFSSLASIGAVDAEFQFQALVTQSEILLLVLVFYLLLCWKDAWKIASGAILVVVLFGVCVNLVEFFSRGAIQLSTVPGRAAGFYENANNSGYYLVFGALISVWILPRVFRLPYLLVVFVGILVTFSRSAMIMWMFACLAVVWYRGFGLGGLWGIVSGGLIVSFIGFSLVTGRMADYLESAGMDNLLDSNTTYRLQSGFLEREDGSSIERAEVAKRGWDLFLSYPIVGVGFGVTQYGGKVVSVHNQALRFAAELGVIGLGLFAGLIWIMWDSGTPAGRAIALVYAVGSMFSHNLLDSPAIAIVIAFVLASRVGFPRGWNEDRTPRVRPLVARTIMRR